MRADPDDPARAAPDMPSSGHVERPVQRRVGDGVASAGDRLAEEVPVSLLFNERPFAVMLATPRDLEDFALGFSLSEGLVEDATQLREVRIRARIEGIELSITVDADAPVLRADTQGARSLPGRSGCGLCGARHLEEVMRPLRPVHPGVPLAITALDTALSSLAQQQPINARTGAVHAAAWADASGRILLLREDIGRHNALDKLVGAMLREGIPAPNGFVVVTSRASYEIVAKSARAGIGIVAALSAPTALAVDIAERAGICLVGFARPGRCNVYAHAERMVTAGTPSPDEP